MSSARSKNRDLDERVRVFAYACEFWFGSASKQGWGRLCSGEKTPGEPGLRKKDSGRRAGHSRGRVSHLGRVPATQLREQPGDA